MSATFAINETEYDGDEYCYECDDELTGVGVLIIRENGRGGLALTHHCSAAHAAEYVEAEGKR